MARSKKYNQEEFINELKVIQPDLEVIGQFKGLLLPMLVKDEYGICNTYPLGLLKGYKPTIQTAINKRSYFENQARQVHGDKYNYNLVNYINTATKVTIICPEHGVFKAIPNTHLAAHGCKKCFNESPCKLFSYSRWEELALKSKYFTGFKVYIIECWNKEERFYKIGKTFTNVGSRFAKKKEMPYQWKLLKTYEGDSRFICELEHKLHIKNRDYKYTPQIYFGGITECFSQINNLK